MRDGVPYNFHDRRIRIAEACSIFLGQQVLQPSALVLELLQPFWFGQVHAAELGPQSTDRLRNAVLVGEFGSLRAGLTLLQHPDNSFFSEPCSVHQSQLAERSKVSDIDLRYAPWDDAGRRQIQTAVAFDRGAIGGRDTRSLYLDGARTEPS